MHVCSLFIFGGLLKLLMAKEWLPRCLNSECEKFEDDTNRTLVTSCEPDNVGQHGSVLGVHHLARVEVSPKNATCGVSSPTKFCAWKNGQACRTCLKNGTADENFFPEYMVDEIDWKWWQSILQPPDSTGRDLFPINITIKLPMKFILTDNIKITFHESQPRDMFVEKSSDHGKTWTIVQYFSDNCKGVFGLDPVQEQSDGKLLGVDGLKAFCIQKSGEEQMADPEPPKVHVLIQREAMKKLKTTDLCRALISDTDGVKSFLEITDLRIRLLRTAASNRGGGNADLKKHYGIDQVSIHGRCQCNGHSNSCSYDLIQRTANCDCRHNTARNDCSKCKKFYWMREWERGEYGEDNKGEAGLCLSYSSKIYREKTWKKPYAIDCKNIYETIPVDINECDCNGHSRRCTDVGKVYGREMGFFCLDCDHNTTGKNCQRCRRGFYQNKHVEINSSSLCIPCKCDRQNARKSQCKDDGRCVCRTGSTSFRCNYCLIGFYKTSTGRCVKIPERKSVQETKKRRKNGSFGIHAGCPASIFFIVLSLLSVFV